MYLKTPRGEFKIEKEFSTRKEANENKYFYYFTHENIDIYTYHIDLYHCKIGIVKRKI